jgi:Family of unknown function (DUF6152)
MNKRSSLKAAAAGAAAFWLPAAQAHHGWSSFNEAQSFYLAGVIRQARWQNPHAEIELAPDADLKLPADLAQRKVPQQTNPVDVAQVLKNAQLPALKAAQWTIELAPIFRMEQWRVVPLKAGDKVAVVGYMLARETKPLMRIEVLIVGDQHYGLRSSPA